MTKKSIVAAVILSSLLAAAGGYWFGFRQGWVLSQEADASARGALAVLQLHSLDQGRVDDVKLLWEHDVDFGLLLWPAIDSYPLRSSLNVLWGQNVIPDYEKYVRRLAIY